MDVSPSSPKMDYEQIVSQAGKAFRSERLLYRPLEQDNWPVYRQLQDGNPAWFALSDFSMFRPQPRHQAKDSFMHWMTCPLAVLIALPRPHNEGDDDGPKYTALGILVLSNKGEYHRHRRTMKLFIQIGKKHQGQGYGTEAIKWALDWAFNHAGMHTVTLKVADYNRHAISVYEKIGFIWEGSKRDQLFYGGRWWDVRMYSMTEDEWRNVGEKDRKERQEIASMMLLLMGGKRTGHKEADEKGVEKGVQESEDRVELLKCLESLKRRNRSQSLQRSVLDGLRMLEEMDEIERSSL